MKARLTGPEPAATQRLRGLWVALDNCRYDPGTRRPLEGDVVDADEDLADLCGRMRETGRTACTILYCDEDVEVQEPPASQPSASVRTDLVR
jgi:hypothetical protein